MTDEELIIFARLLLIEFGEPVTQENIVRVCSCYKDAKKGKYDDRLVDLMQKRD